MKIDLACYVSSLFLFGLERPKTERYRALWGKIRGERPKTERYRAVGAKIGPYRPKTERYRAPISYNSVI